MTTARGGVSTAPYAPPATPTGGLNLGDHVGDDPAAVAENRARLETALGRPVVYLTQIHSATVHVLSTPAGIPATNCLPPGDAVVVTGPALAKHAFAIMVADCVPLAFWDPHARVLGMAHAGWRGLAARIIPATLQAMVAAGAAPERIWGWVGAHICAACYRVSPEVAAQFAGEYPDAIGAENPENPALDLGKIAAAQAQASGVENLESLPTCVYESPEYYSYRESKDPQKRCGRQALVALAS